MTWQPDSASSAGMRPAWPGLGAQQPARWQLSASQRELIDTDAEQTEIIEIVTEQTEIIEIVAEQSEAPEQDAAPAARPSRARRLLRSAALAMVLVVGLGGLASAAVGVAHQVLPRQFSVRQQRQIMAWEVARRWRAFTAGELFPASLAYQLSAEALNGSQGLKLAARRLGIGQQTSCGSEVSPAGASVLTAHRCTALLRATYLDASGSMIVTVGIAVLPDSSAAATAARQLSAAGQNLTFAVEALAVPGTLAAGFTDRQRQLLWATADGPYVLMATAGFSDGRRHLPISTDPYYDQEMTSLTVGLAKVIGALIGAQPPPPRCPGAPGC